MLINNCKLDLLNDSLDLDKIKQNEIGMKTHAPIVSDQIIEKINRIRRVKQKNLFIINQMRINMI